VGGFGLGGCFCCCCCLWFPSLQKSADFRKKSRRKRKGVVVLMGKIFRLRSESPWGGDSLGLRKERAKRFWSHKFEKVRVIERNVEVRAGVKKLGADRKAGARTAKEGRVNLKRTFGHKAGIQARGLIGILPGDFRTKDCRENAREMPYAQVGRTCRERLAPFP